MPDPHSIPDPLLERAKRWEEESTPCLAMFPGSSE